MKLSFLFGAALLGASSLFANAHAQQTQLANDPSSYFGGVNHQSYLDWIQDNGIDTKYNSSVYIPSSVNSKGAAVHWSVDDEYFHVAVAARATGWVGFGLGDAGGMLGSDMALFTALRPNELVDAHVVDQFFPKPDDCQQDWVLLDSTIVSVPVALERQNGDDPFDSEDFIMFEARRKLNTTDPQDIVIVRDNLLSIPEQRIIAAWGDTPEVSYHGPNVARGSIRVFQHEIQEPDFETSMANHASGSFFVGANNYVIPTNDTTYADFCVSRAALIAQGVPDTTDRMSVIGFRPVVDDGPSAPFVHHYVVTGIFNASEEACVGEETAGMDMVYVWAPGDGPFALPEFLGANLFGEDGFQGFNIEIHYDNPRFVEGIVDNSGVEIYYTTTPRDVEMAVLQVGDPYIGLFGELVGEGYNLHSFDCPSSCSDLYLDEPVTVFREYLHMHETGSRMTNEQIRGGETIRTASVEVWDFHQNGNLPSRQDPFQLMPGDSFRTNCYYNGNRDTIFGLGSREEMCMSFLYYYPRKTVSLPTPQGNMTIPYLCSVGFDFMDGACNAQHTGAALESVVELDRQFGKQGEECPSDVSANVNPVEAEEGTEASPEATETEGERPVPETEGDVVQGSTPASGASSFAKIVVSSGSLSAVVFLASFMLI